MKVLLVSSGSGSRGGGEIFLDYLGQTLSEHGHEVVTWIPAHVRMNELANKCATFGRVVRANYRNTYDYRLRSLATNFNVNTSNRIAHDWEAIKPDIIHINKQNLEDGLDLLSAAGECQVPSICTIHLTQSAHYLGAKGWWLRDFIARRSLRKYRGPFVTVEENRSRKLAEFLRDGHRLATILNGVPEPDLSSRDACRAAVRKELGLPSDSFLVLAIGRLVEQKRPFLFLQIAKEIHARLPSARFVWVGDGSLREEWQRAIQKEALGGIMFGVGWKLDVAPYLAASDLFLHVAEFEGLPFALIESLAAQLPCAITRDLAAKMSFFSADQLLIADDVDHLVQTLQNPRNLREVAVNGHSLFLSKLSVATMAASYEKLYDAEIRRSCTPAAIG